LARCTWVAPFPAAKPALEQIPPLSFLSLRFLLGTLIIAGWFLATGYGLRRQRGILAAGAVATGFLVFGFALQTVGRRYTSASNSAFLTALYVVLVPLMLRRFDRRVIVATVIATGGLWLLVKPSATMNLGDVMTIGC